MTALAGSRSQYLATTVARLWPDTSAAVVVGLGSPGAGDADWFVLPSRSRPRLLVPTGTRAAAVMLRRHDAGRRDALIRALLRRGVATGLLRWLPTARLRVASRLPAGGGIATLCADVLQTPVSVGVLLGPERANQKPVLQVFSGAETLAFAKVDVSGDPTLVDGEVTALARLAQAGLELLEVPRVLFHGRWQDLAVAVLSPLPASQARRSDDDPELHAAAEVAAIGGVRLTPLVDVLTRLTAALDELPEGPDTVRVHDVLGRLAGAAPSLSLSTGAWHGDWAPWNMGRSPKDPGTLQVWDWERFATDVPYGLDAVHHRCQLLWRDGVPADRCGHHLEKAAAAMPAPPTGSPVPPDLLRTLYLVEIALRYLRDQPAGAPARPRTRWILDQLSAPATLGTA